RKTRVLLFASGPMRDYQFLRNQLHRDNTMVVDVLLQTAQSGISQDANTILDHFPSTPEELYQYDCIVAFDPDWTKLDAAQVYLASQFYGAGQVFYIGSGEFWRLRGVDPAYFEVLYTKLIRHVSQGRILRGSSHGSLLVERDRYELGEPVVVRARLSDSQHKPLTEPSLTTQLLRPDGTT